MLLRAKRCNIQMLVFVYLLDAMIGPLLSHSVKVYNYVTEPENIHRAKPSFLISFM